MTGKDSDLIYTFVFFFNLHKDNPVIDFWGEKRVAPPGQKLKNHVDLVELLDIVDTKRGAEIAGGRGFFLKGDGVLLNQALIRFGLDFLKKREFTLLQPPFFMRKEVMAKCAQLAQHDEQLYRVCKNFCLVLLLRFYFLRKKSFVQGDWWWR